MRVAGLARTTVLSLSLLTGCSADDGDDPGLLTFSSAATFDSSGNEVESGMSEGDTQASDATDSNPTDTAGDGDSSGDGDSDPTASTSGDGDGDTGDGDTGDGDTSSTTDPSTSTGSTTGTDSTGGTEFGCEGVDFLFIIDNSGSMGDEQNALVASFDGFIDTIEERMQMLEADSFHILVADTDTAAYTPDPACNFECEFTGGSICQQTGISCDLYEPNCWFICASDPYATCNGQSCADVVGCNDDPCHCEIGAGSVEDNDGGDCGVVGGQNYMTEAQSMAPTTVKDAFSCMATVGTDGSGSERQADAVLAAVSDSLNAPGSCNDGFSRANSILVVTVISDEDDVASSGNPADWKSQLVQYKGGDEAGIVVLGLIGDLNQPGAVCTQDAGSSGGDDATRLRQFVTSMDNHVLGSVCEPSYNTFFENAVDLIEETCISFPIPE